jgi:hypothetical protein
MEPNPSYSDFDLRTLVLSDVSAGGKTPVAERAIVVRQPRKNEFIRTNPDFTVNLATLIDSSTGDTYIVSKEIMAEFPSEVDSCVVALAATSLGEIFIWPARRPRFDNDGYGHSRMQGLNVSKTAFVRLRANREANEYDIVVAKNDLPAPVWPTESFEEILRKVFEKRVISSPDHEVFRRLMGEIA